MSSVILDADSGADLRLIVALAKKMNIKVISLTKKEREEMEDLKLLQLMQEAQKEGLADTKDVLSKLSL
jgi:hypothetical protein